MKYFFDTEFHERIKNPLFGKKHHLMELISIGIVDEDGRTYYAVSSDFDLKAAWKNEWLRENVLHSIYNELRDIQNENTMAQIWYSHLWEGFTYSSLKVLISWHGKKNDEIAAEIFNFVNPDLGFNTSSYSNSDFRDPMSPMSLRFAKHNVVAIKEYCYAQPEFYAYYADYDWVLLCSLFGNMMKLPPGFPMYCKDLKQYKDQAAMRAIYFADVVPATNSDRIEKVKTHDKYPVNKNNHNALADAQWNQKLYNFLKEVHHITM